MQSVLQANHGQPQLSMCFRYSLYITGSHFEERFTNIANMGAVIDRCQIRTGQNPKIRRQPVLQLVLKLKESVPPPFPWVRVRGHHHIGPVGEGW